MERVEQLGGKVGIDSQSPGQPVEGIDFSKTAIQDGDLACLEPFPGMRWLFLDETKITDAALAKLEPYKQLQNLSLGGTQVGDAGLEHLSRLSGLRRLSLGRTAVTDAGLEKLASLSGLKVLDLTGGTQLSPASIAKLKERLPKLVVLK